jgi:RNA polymerase sigma-70 factor (ECF subfamily)
MSTPLTNNELLLLKRGDEYGFNAFYTAFYGMNYMMAAEILNDQDEAKDIVSETFVKLWLRHKNFDSIGAVYNFLKETTKNACLNLLEKKKRERKKYKEAAYLLDHLDEHQIDRAVIKPELLEAIDEMIEQLPNDCRDIFKMIWYEGKRAKEVAGKLNIPEYTVSRKMAKAVKIMKSVPFTNRLLLLLFFLFYMFFKK